MNYIDMKAILTKSTYFNRKGERKNTTLFTFYIPLIEINDVSGRYLV